MNQHQPFEPILSSKAEETLRQLDTALAELVENHIFWLCQAPVSRNDGQSVIPAEWPNHQAYRFRIIRPNGEQHYFRVLFKYYDDEKHIWIAGIGHQQPPSSYRPPQV
jgi:mRNA-degrading endonuclease RelE of RelBE toxin-antitoxin system